MSCGTRKKGSYQRLLDLCQKDTTAYKKEFPLTKYGTIWKRKINKQKIKTKTVWENNDACTWLKHNKHIKVMSSLCY